MPATATINDLIKTDEAARILGISVHTLIVWRFTGRNNLPFVRLGRSVRYRRSDLDAWIASRRVVSAVADEVSSDA